MSFSNHPPNQLNNPPTIPPGQTATILAALQFTVEKQVRRMQGEEENTTRLSHRIYVTEVLSRIGRVTDTVTLTAAILHEVFDGTRANKLEVDEFFGDKVRFLVQELAECRELSQPELMLDMLQRIPTLSLPAKEVVLAEKICKLQAITATGPTDWSIEQKCGYMTWIAQIVGACRGSNALLENHFDELLQERIELLGIETDISRKD